MLSSTTSLIACTGRRWPSRWIRSIASVNKFSFGSSFDETKHTIFNLQLKSFVKKRSMECQECTYCRIPPTVHEVYAGCFCQVQSNTSSFQADKEDCHINIVHWWWWVRVKIRANNGSKPYWSVWWWHLELGVTSFLPNGKPVAVEWAFEISGNSQNE